MCMRLLGRGDVQTHEDLWDWQQIHFEGLFHLETYHNGDYYNRVCLHPCTCAVCVCTHTCRYACTHGHVNEGWARHPSFRLSRVGKYKGKACWARR